MSIHITISKRIQLVLTADEAKRIWQELNFFFGQNPPPTITVNVKDAPAVDAVSKQRIPVSEDLKKIYADPKLQKQINTTGD